MAATKTPAERKKDFLDRLKKLYPDYELSGEYIDNDTMITLVHKDGYQWKTKPRYLDGKRQCTEVNRLNRSKKEKVGMLTKEQLIEKFYEKWDRDQYELLDFSYIGLRATDLRIIHKGGCGKEFVSNASNMLYVNRKGCSHCFAKSKRTHSDFTNLLAQKHGPEYIAVGEYENSKTPIKLRHNIEGCGIEFDMRPEDILANQKCPVCSRKKRYRNSTGVQWIREILSKEEIHFEEEKTFPDMTSSQNGKLRLDFFLPEFDIAIEYDGKQHFAGWADMPNSRLEDIQRRDKEKNDYCRKKGIKLIRLNYMHDNYSKMYEALFNALQ